jgi:glycosidase
MVYYGDEAGMWGGDDPDDRKPMLWQEFSYADEVSHPFGKSRPADANSFNPELFDVYRTLIALRRAHPALSLGAWKTFVTDDRGQVFAFGRRYREEKVIVVLNNSLSPQACRFAPGGEYASANWKVVYGQGTPIVTKRLVRLTVPAKQGVVLVAGQP